ncbi:hypothetical protein CPC08DRAFT_93941 [Agrocybe pediades]|nr:hypothetical protein CPC08DRAFT_93941 [Agrocybe pediades]
MSSTGVSVLLRPRPYETSSGALLLLPLLPQPEPLKPLPSEIWANIFMFSLASSSNDKRSKPWAWALLTICKAFHEIILPQLYSSIHITSLGTLQGFYDKLHVSDQKWDSIRRIPYSTPGRWVQILDLSDLLFESQTQALMLDSLLTQLFPLIPSLTALSMNPSLILSRRALSALGQRDGAVNLRSLTGLCYISPLSNIPDDDPFVQLFRNTPNLTTLVIAGRGLDPFELEFGYGDTFTLPDLTNFRPLLLPKLQTLSLLSMHFSPLMLALLKSELPNLRKLTVTPYDDIQYPASLSSAFIAQHSAHLTSLLLFTPKSWPTRLHPSPTEILAKAPNLNHLSLENPLPSLVLTEKHSLRILSIPRPIDSFWRIFERLLPYLPNLVALHIRDVRWLRKGVSSMAQGAGVQGEMREWKRRLDRRRIRLFDADWKEDA